MTMDKSLTAVSARASTVGSAAPAGVPDAARTELAPTGVLRAAMNLGNRLFTTPCAATGGLRGVSVDLMHALADRLGVPVVFVVYDTPGDVADAVNQGTWDVAVLAIAQARAKTIAFSAAMTAIEATYLVHQDSALASVDQVDAAGVRVCAPEKAGYELYLTETLREATLVRTQGVAAATELFKNRQAHALAGLKPDLLDTLPSIPGARMLKGNFMVVNHGLCTARTRQAAAAYLQDFVQEMNASGFIAQSIEQHGVQGLSAV